jgi:hypothetical protein
LKQRSISKNTLIEILGQRAGASALKAVARGEDARIPDFDMLDPGDIVLVKSRKPSGSSQLIADVQEQILNFRPHEARWTHSMVYVGDLHVAESQKAILGWPGTRVAALTKYAATCDMTICRFAGERFSLAEANGIARWALLDCTVGKRSYDNARAYSSATMTRPQKANLGKAVICSEFALECLAVGGAVMVGEYNEVINGKRFFYPADFIKSDAFRKIPLQFLELKN